MFPEINRALAASAIDLVVETSRRATQVDDDEAAVTAFDRSLDPTNDAALDCPGFVGIAHRTRRAPRLACSIRRRCGV